MKRIISLLTSAFLFVFALSLQNCTEEIDIELEKSFTRLVITGGITTDTARHSILLRKTVDYDAPDGLPPVPGAKVFINDMQLHENDTAAGLYQTSPDVYGLPGETYRLRVEGVDVDNDGTNETYTAKSVMPGIPVADSIDVVYTEFNSFFKAWEVLVYAQDPPDEINFYLFKVMKNDTLLSDTLDEWIVQDDELLNGAYIPGMTAQFIEDANDSLQVRKNDTITLITQAITQSYNSYYWELNAESSFNSPLFSGPPANVSTNLESTDEHGPVGFFETHAVSRISKVIENPGLLLSELRP